MGTRHYRSIEQLDFCDTAQCDVDVCGDGQRALLRSRDPKFIDTNIRKGDMAYFAKSNTRRLFNIVDLRKDPMAGLVEVHIEMSQPPGVPEDGEEAEASVLVSDTNTQISFLKNPTAKTDLFGLGAILFDILSAGDSPERFYELLRRFDTSGREHRCERREALRHLAGRHRRRCRHRGDFRARLRQAAVRPSTSKSWAFCSSA